MNPADDAERGVIWEELGSWTVRGVLCALPSFVLAIFAGFDRPHALAAMLIGIATWVGGLAWATSRPAYRVRIGAHAFGWALRAAANTRAALALVALFWPDMWLGFFAYGITRIGAREAGFGDIEPQNTFLGTYATTLIQGTLIFLTIVLLAGALVVARVAWRRWHGPAGAPRVA